VSLGITPDPPVLSISYSSEEIKKIDKKYLDVGNPDFNANPGDEGYIENRTHYTANVGTLVYDASKLGGKDSFNMPFGDQAVPFYKVSEYSLDDDTLKNLTVYVAESADGEKTALGGSYIQSNNGYRVCIKDYVYIACIDDPILAGSTMGTTIPSAGTYFLVLSETYTYAEATVGELVKQLDPKYVDLSNHYTKAEADAAVDTKMTEHVAKYHEKKWSSLGVITDLSEILNTDATYTAETVLTLSPWRLIGDNTQGIFCRAIRYVIDVPPPPEGKMRAFSLHVGNGYLQMDSVAPAGTSSAVELTIELEYKYGGVMVHWYTSLGQRHRGFIVNRRDGVSVFTDSYTNGIQDVTLTSAGTVEFTSVNFQYVPM